MNNPVQLLPRTFVIKDDGSEFRSVECLVGKEDLWAKCLDYCSVGGCSWENDAARKDVGVYYRYIVCTEQV